MGAGSMARRRRLRREPFRLPTLPGTHVAKPIVQAVSTRHPEFHDARREGEHSPVRRTRHDSAGKALFLAFELGLEFGAIRKRAALR